MKKNRGNSNGVRNPTFAGSFYPADSEQLQGQLLTLFKQAKAPVIQQLPQAIIAPHAGLIYSGAVAASAYNQLTEAAHYKRVFIIASSHQYTFKGASPDSTACYSTPLGKVMVDSEVTNKLLSSGRMFNAHYVAHQNEHSIEVQLPFLQHKLGSDFMLVPILIGTHKLEECEQIARQLEPWFTPGNLFVVSTDFSHYPAYKDAVENDYNTAEAICSNNPHTLMKNLENEREIPNLATSLCGWPAVATLLFLSQYKNMDFRLIHYQNSGDADPYGDKEKVVGYWAIAVYDNLRKIYISEEMQKSLLQNARESVVRFVQTGDSEPFVLPDEPEGISPGMFVSVFVKGELRGCVGSFGNVHSLNKEVEYLAVSASCDSRFSDISPYELDDMNLEISILSPPRKIKTAEEIVPGKHGIFLKKGSNTGTYLPKVAALYGWDTLELLGHCARDKARIGWNGWKSADIYIFEAFVFGD